MARIKLDSVSKNYLKLMRTMLVIRYGALDDYSDFDNFAIFINKNPKIKNKLIGNSKGKEMPKISEKTIRNLLDGEPSLKSVNSTTLTIFSVLLDYHDWTEFCASAPKVDPKNLYFDPLQIDCSKIEIGKVVTIGWKPHYFATFECIGKFQFKVLECSDNTKLFKDQIKKIYGFGIQYLEHIDDITTLDGKIEPISGYLYNPKITFRVKKTKVDTDAESHFFSICG